MRVLVPLDGTDLAASILPDALRLAGPDGSLVLVREASIVAPDLPGSFYQQRAAVQTARDYLEAVAQTLRSGGARVECLPLVVGDPALAIDEAAQAFSVDMVAAATHGWNLAERWWRGSIAWRALLRSTTPVMLRHTAGPTPNDTGPRRILVPLDGSDLALKALPLASWLADRWDAELWLARAVSLTAPADPAFPIVDGNLLESAKEYLEGVGSRLNRPVKTCVAQGPAVDALARMVEDHGITDVVMSSHGRTGLARVIVGSVAEGLIHRLHCPIIVIPPLVTLSSKIPEGNEAVEPVTS